MSSAVWGMRPLRRRSSWKMKHKGGKLYVYVVDGIWSCPLLFKFLCLLNVYFNYLLRTMVYGSTCNASFMLSYVSLLVWTNCYWINDPGFLQCYLIFKQWFNYVCSIFIWFFSFHSISLVQKSECSQDMPLFYMC